MTSGVRIACASTIAAFGCGRISFAPLPPDATPDAIGPAHLSCGPFGPPTLLPGGVSAAGDDWTPHISADDLSIYWYSQRVSSPGAPDVWRSTRVSTSVDFGPGTVVTEVSSPNVDTSPTVTADELVLVLSSDRLNPGVGATLFMASRASKAAPFSTPARIDELQAAGVDFAGAPDISHDGLHVLFHGSGPTSLDLFEISRADRSAPFGTKVTSLDALNSAGAEFTPGVSADRLEVFFVSDRAGGAGKFDIYRATRTSTAEPWGNVENVSVLNSTDDEYGPSLSADSTTLYFSYMIPIDGSSGDSSVYIATRTCN